ncbi:LysM peptidoglycan-binding domain-containing protein [Hymenobacter lapidiphilus]|uniref:LysM peptidoglycan-binding domain-containing protein n=1 Tax=Hymenobacter lapidiphilus TaxID=2608003 RepID=A0A7Y7PPN4_9BACT|nr:LysM peptidoglycan-binding domain-containing protein [Hymenobacter lapidiphilus]NVO31688.1 LysM peptidoglycan-binding domain-containing protein [Hymenobacter lapidiphilus]
MSRFPLLTAALVFSGLSAWAAPAPVAPPDSIGVEYRNNKLLIRHRVTAGETIYGLSRRYKVPVEDIVEANSGQKGQLNMGQIVLIPRTRVVLTPAPATAARAATTVAAPTASVRALPTDADGNRLYKVTPGMTLYAIARRFQTTPAELARLNGFSADHSVRVGEVVIIAAPATGAAGPPAPVTAAARPTAREKAVARDAEREKARDEASSPAVTPEAKDTSAPAPARVNEAGRRVTESGLAMVIPTDASDKYLALHKTAAVGTIMEVRNIMNGQAVYVRVIGRLPDTGENDKVLLRLSKRAVQRLATPDQRFRVETSYVP